jgi:hypothetical protein
VSRITWAFWDLGERAHDAWQMASTHPLLGNDSTAENGLAGFGLASLYLYTQTHDNEYLRAAASAGKVLVTRQGPHRPVGISAHGGARYIGYAKGASGISLFLLYLYMATIITRFSTGRSALLAELQAAQCQADRCAYGPPRSAKTTDPALRAPRKRSLRAGRV